jgi:flagellar motor protein MotB
VRVDRRFEHPRTLPAARSPLLGALLATVIPLAACGATPMRVASLDEVERVRTTDAAKESATRAPEAYARAEQERAFARAAHAAGDDVAANLHAERAMAAYGHAEAVARLARAVADLADAQKALDDATVEEQSLAASRAKLDLEAQDLERRVEIARDRLLPAPSSQATADRETARLAAARSLAVEARLLCEAARLVGPSAPGLTEAQGEVEKLDARLGPASPTSPAAGPRAGTRSEVIDDAGLARAHCLDVLTRSRRAATVNQGDPDALLSELSASGGWDPTRDERGVVVTLRGVYQGATLSDAGEAKLESLGRVAAAHPSFGIQVVVHDAQPPSGKDGIDARRGEAAVKALVTGGATAARVKAELVGARAPTVDPGDSRLRGRNERIDIVFVVGG